MKLKLSSPVTLPHFPTVVKLYITVIDRKLIVNPQMLPSLLINQFWALMPGNSHTSSSNYHLKSYSL